MSRKGLRASSPKGPRRQGRDQGPNGTQTLPMYTCNLLLCMPAFRQAPSNCFDGRPLGLAFAVMSSPPLKKQKLEQSEYRACRVFLLVPGRFYSLSGEAAKDEMKRIFIEAALVLHHACVLLCSGLRLQEGFNYNPFQKKQHLDDDLVEAIEWSTTRPVKEVSIAHFVDCFPSWHIFFALPGQQAEGLHH